ncbi:MULTISPECIES: polyketide synthase [unclassified Mycobacterium]|uniref:beta-ketoacyl [acyl carrier protein] synthase domain-containing protein n=1 Tax=unclassified Mycobacterium TaxID=2642494 RepID=UPI0007400E4C|nr:MULTISPECIES: polyketide synthase [unclassified Mycobacterium]KUH80484.1 beta-ketoacyl synthase [Mycobacterium sp. GA-1999]KUH89228.1 beta-ketoacyl synthase [Mycobacterium sp. GA-0227b]KUH95963.1 beta-ketoacyl synthase [Mycobacterium sp. IS-1556]
MQAAPDIDPMVVSGMAVAAPGEVHTPLAYWSALSEARELIGPMPRDRGWPLEDMFTLSRHDGWADVCDAGGFLADAGAFDPVFFNISQREAAVTNPQIRLAMRVAWKAVENTGINAGALDEEEAGCFVGAYPTEYGPLGTRADEYSGYRTVGMVTDSIAGRVSHSLGLSGPSATVNTACASSLTALHLAAAAVRNDECDWALAGGVCVMGSPVIIYDFAKHNALAADGHCRAYADDATGTLWGEGAGFVVVERESRARRLGHRIFGRILASHYNHNGKGKAILTPRADAQEKLIRRVIDAAGIDAADVGMIEGHGTATRAGDRAELTALVNTYGAAHSTAFVGSSKSNLGHAQGAAGMLGVIKVLLAGWHGQIPASLFTDNPTTQVDWDRTGLRLATKLHPWEAKDGSRYGAVSSYGAGGVNAHTIIGMPMREENDDF